MATHESIQAADIHCVENWQPPQVILWRGTVLYQLWFSTPHGKRELRPVPTLEQAAKLYSLDNVPVNEAP